MIYAKSYILSDSLDSIKDECLDYFLDSTFLIISSNEIKDFPLLSKLGHSSDKLFVINSKTLEVTYGHLTDLMLF